MRLFKLKDTKTTTADKWFSLFIRLRDSDENGYAKCCTCSRIAHAKNMDTGHFLKRQYQAVRFSEINCNTQCKHCNNFEQGNDVKYREFLVRKYGEAKILLLEASKRQTVKRSANDLKMIADYYKEKVAELMKDKNFSKWW